MGRSAGERYDGGAHVARTRSRKAVPLRSRVGYAQSADGIPFTIRQAEADLLFADVEWVSPGIIRVKRGRKQLRNGETDVAVEPGEILYIPAGTRLEVRNVPDGDLYEAEGIVLSVGLASHLPARSAVASSPGVKTLRIAEHGALDTALTRGLDGYARKLSVGVQRARLLEIVACLADAGIDPFFAASDVRLRLKRMVAEDPARDWRIGHVARRFGMSEDSLQRRLRSDRTSFSQLVQEVRMEQALNLLWTTERPLALVAEQSGYDSPSRFAQRFRDRFGVLPSELRRRR
jgi:AraC-like DNA-binding protein